MRFIDFHTKFHVPSSNDSLGIAIKPEVNVILGQSRYYILHLKIILIKVLYFSKIYYHASFQDI
jgi:hypothetical protein